MRTGVISCFHSIVMIFAVGIALSPRVLLAQDPVPPTGVGAFMPSALEPGAPSGSYTLTDFDHVNLSNLHVSFYIPVAPSMGRGNAKLPIGVSLDRGQIAFSPTTPINGGCTGPQHCSYTYNYYPGYSMDHTPPLYAGASLFPRSWGYGCVHTYTQQGGDGTGGGNYWANAVSTISMVRADGSQTEFLDQQFGGQAEAETADTQLTGQYDGQNRKSLFWANDGSTSKFVSSPSMVNGQNLGSDVFDAINCTNYSSNPTAGSNGTVSTRDGTTYTFTSPQSTTPPLISTLVVQDRNGNQVNLSDNQTTLVTTITDSLGRTTTLNLNANPTPQTITYPGANGVTRTVTVTSNTGPGVLRADWQTKFNSMVANYSPDNSHNCGTSGNPALCPGASYMFGGVPFVTGSQWSASDITNIQLPYQNGTSGTHAYTIQYDFFGNVARINLPTGGAYEYDYTQYTWCTGTCPNSGAWTSAAVLAEKRVYADQSTSWVERTTYTPNQTTTTNAPVFTEVQVQHYQPDGTSTGVLSGQENHFLMNPVNGTGELNAWSAGKEYEVDILDAASPTTILEKKVTNWAQRSCASGDRLPCAWFTGYNGIPPAHDPQITSEVVTYGTTASSATSAASKSYLYDYYNNRTSVTEADFTGSTIRTTLTNYTAMSSNYSAYNTANIFNLPLNVQVNDSSGTQVAYTTLGYDETAPLAADCTSPLEFNSSSYGTSFNTRGNVTSVNKMVLDTVNSTVNGTMLTTTLTYDVLGNVKSVHDPRGVYTTFSYFDSIGSCALPTTIGHFTALGVGTTPTFTEKLTYDYSIGKPTTYSDLNNQSTAYSYDEPGNLDRLHQVTRPDGGTTQFTYNDLPSGTPLTVETIAATDQVTVDDGAVKSYVYYDGLGRVLRRSTSAPEANTITYAYDFKGRAFTASNPGSTTLLTTTLYDNLDRVVKVEAADGAASTPGSTTSYTYTPDTTTKMMTTRVVDPAGVNRIQYNDGAGRLVRVDENGTLPATVSCGGVGGTSYATCYGYDALDDLTSVTQGALSRSFVYDSLRRLVKAVNPESGTTKYLYDSSGNLATKTNALNIVTCFGSLVSTNCTPSYDGLNRPGQKSYSDQSTAQVTYTYDTGGSAVYANGRLTAVGATNSTASTLGYDQMGRVNSVTQTIPGYTTAFSMSYKYFLSGAVNTFTYPSGRKLTYGYDAADRPTTASGVLNSATTNYVLSGTTYWPNGALQQFTTSAPYPSNQTCQNTLMQTNGIRVGPSAAFWNYTLPATCQSPTQLSGDALFLGFSYNGLNNTNVNQQTNNGNVTQQTIMTSEGLNLTQNYAYDPYNRISTVAESGSNNEFSQTYTIDQYGNRAVSGYIPNADATPEATSEFNAKNQWAPGAGYTYDSAGNQTSTGSRQSLGAQANTYAYDAENRLKSANIGNTGTVTYTYDGEGRRVQKTVGSATTSYVYDGGGALVAEYSNQAPVTTGTEWLADDHLGSMRLVMSTVVPQGNPTGILKRYDYLPFGEEIPSGTGGRGVVYGTTASLMIPGVPDVVSDKFTGQERDSETGLDYFGARYFSGTQGRFTSPDEPFADQEASDPQSWNLYGYVRNNPLGFADLDGRSCINQKGSNGSTITTDNGDGKGCSALQQPTVVKDRQINVDDEELRQFVQLTNRAITRRTNEAVDIGLQVYQAFFPLVGVVVQTVEGPPSPFYRGGPKPRLVRGDHTGRNPSKSVEPRDAAGVYEHSVQDTTRGGPSTTYYGVNEKGEYYRYQGKGGEVHWQKVERPQDVPLEIRKELGGPIR